MPRPLHAEIQQGLVSLLSQQQVVSLVAVVSLGPVGPLRPLGPLGAGLDVQQHDVLVGRGVGEGGDGGGALRADGAAVAHVGAVYYA